jgi:hypothetical protein
MCMIVYAKERVQLRDMSALATRLLYTTKSNVAHKYWRDQLCNKDIQQVHTCSYMNTRHSLLDWKFLRNADLNLLAI